MLSVRLKALIENNNLLVQINKFQINQKYIYK